jgi:DNA-binding transcriptional MerR regulator
MSDRSQDADRGLLIGEAAGLLGITPKAIRLYHRLELLPEPERDESDYRRYLPHELATLARIVRLRDVGLSLREIRPLLRAEDGGTSLQRALQAFDEQLAIEIADRRRRRRLLTTLRDEGIDDPLHASAPGVIESHLVERLRQLIPDMTPDEEAFERRLQRALAAFQLPGADAAPTERADALADELLDLTGGRQGLIERHRRLYALADAELDDPRIPVLAEEMRAVMRRTGEALSDPERPSAVAKIDDAEVRRWSAGISAALGSLPPAVRQVWEIVFQELLHALNVTSRAPDTDPATNPSAPTP